MFSLRSSPSSLVCDLRNTLLPGAEGGFQLSAPRPRRASVRLGFDIYYAGADGHCNGEADGGFSTGGGGGSALSPAVSDYAGVFEAGDPARARESMNNFGAAAAAAAPPTAVPVEERAPRGDDRGGSVHQETRLEAGAEEHRAAADGDGVAAGWSVALDGHGESSPEEAGGLEEDSEFLFEMEGLKDEHHQHERGMRVSNGGSRSTGGRGRGGGEGWGAAAIAGAAAAAAAAAAASNRGVGSRGGVVDSGAASAGAPGNFQGTPTYASLAPPSLSSGGGKQQQQQQQRVGAAAAATGAVRVGGGGGGSSAGGGTALRKPRVIAPRGTRCVGGGMYRLRLSTSC